MLLQNLCNKNSTSFADYSQNFNLPTPQNIPSQRQFRLAKSLIQSSPKLQIQISDLTQKIIKDCKLIDFSFYDEQSKSQARSINQIQNFQRYEIQSKCNQHNLPPLNLSRLKLFRGGNAFMYLNTQRNDVSFDYRKNRQSDIFYNDQEDTVIQFIQKEVQSLKEEGDKSRIESYFQDALNMSSQQKEKNPSDSFKLSNVADQVQSNGDFFDKKSLNWQKKQNNIQNQLKDYYQKKINDLKLKLQEKVRSNTQLSQQNQDLIKKNYQFQQSNESQAKDLKNAIETIHSLEQKICQFQQYVEKLHKNSQTNEQKLIDQIQRYSQAFQEKNEELNKAFELLELLAQNLNEKERDFDRQISALENNIRKINQEVQLYKRSFNDKGIDLDLIKFQITEQITQEIQIRHSRKIQDIKNKHETQISALQQKINDLQIRINELFKQEQLSSDFRIKSQQKLKQKNTQVNEVIDMYDTELQKRDNEILQLKRTIYYYEELLNLVQELNKHQNIQQISLTPKTFRVFQQKQSTSHPHREATEKILIDQTLHQNQEQLQSSIQTKQTNLNQLNLTIFNSSKPLQNSIQTIDVSETQYKHPQDLSNRIVKELKDKIELLMNQLQHQKEEKKKLKEQIQDNNQKKIMSDFQEKSILKQKVQKLSKYSKALQKQLKDIYRLSQCQSHLLIIQRLQNQLQIHKAYNQEENSILPIQKINNDRII